MVNHGAFATIQSANKWTVDSCFHKPIEQIDSTDIGLASTTSSTGTIFHAILQLSNLSLGVRSLRHQTSHSKFTWQGNH